MHCKSYSHFCSKNINLKIPLPVNEFVINALACEANDALNNRAMMFYISLNMIYHWEIIPLQSNQGFCYPLIHITESNDSIRKHLRLWSGLEVIKLFSCSTQLSMKKVLTVGIFIFMTKWNFMLSWVEHEKSFITSGPDCANAQADLGLQCPHMP